MPLLFDYKCPSCGHWKEELVAVPDAKIECPQCGAMMQKQLSAPAEFIGKGEGFNKSANNYRNNRY